MDRRIELHNKLLTFLPNVYFQPPSNITMTYPCIVYSKSSKMRRFGNDDIYLSSQEYQLMVIENNPDSKVADELEKDLSSCVISQYYTMDNLNHTTLNLYY